MRKLAFHEQKLLKKVDFLHWKSEDNLRELKLLRRYHIQKREDYVAYNRLAGLITKLTAKLGALPPASAVRVRVTAALLARLFAMGVIDTASSLAKAAALPATAFARRRLPIVLVRLRMAETVRAAVTLVEQGEVRVGPETVSDPAFLVTRAQEDFVTWVDSGRTRRVTDKYNDKLDDYDLLEGT
jgi:U3 small nucleolar ribonucleoprotein protein IMP3